jgi:hypothetical protein
MMSSKMIPTSELDFSTRIPVHRQNFVCMSFLSPDSGIEDRNPFCAQGLPVHCLRESQNADQSSAEKFPMFRCGRYPSEPCARVPPSGHWPSLTTLKSIHLSGCQPAFEAENELWTSVRGVKV